MTFVESVAVHSPSERVPVASYLPILGVPAHQVELYEQFYGYSVIRRDRAGTLADLLVAVGGRVERDSLRRVRYVIHARTMAVAVAQPADPLGEACRRLGLAHAQAFTVTGHACASGLLAVHLAGSLLTADGDPAARALVLTGEKVFTGHAQLIPDAAVMGESGAAVLVAAGGGGDELLGYAARSVWEFHRDPWARTGRPGSAGRDYAELLAEVVRDAAGTAGVPLADIRLVLPHNINRMALLRLAKLLSIPVGRLFLDNIPRVGHSFCADSFLNYRLAHDQGRLTKAAPYLMTSVGLGTTFSAAVFRH
nr:3-oxoacyl-[acyl-carrier-protein] synthase III C-terminal domain-containing protein [Micromonospora sp. DSM 115978]